MLTKDIRKTIDNARDVLVGKIPNPQSQIEQITIAMIYKFMDDMDIESVEFGGERQFFIEELSEYAWSKIMSPQLGNEARMNLYTEALDKLQLSNRIPKLFRDIFKGAYLPFRDGQTLALFLKEINELSYNNSENLGNGFEYLLSIMGSQGDAGQFRTPRHIIDFIVDIVKPTKADTILDPACGTAGFLISAYKFIQKCAQDSNQPLTPQERTALTENIQGYDISPDMVKLALVNMYLHKFKDPKIYEYDTLTQDTRWENYFDCILANPPFMTPKGGIQPHNKFGVKANRSEVLFVDYIMEHLNSTGRAGVIVPEGIVFQSANAYKELRKKLVDEKYLYAVVSLPSGIFQPYSGVKTSILFMDKQLAKKTDKVLFVEIQNDGFDLGAQRRPIDKNDLPKALEIINQWQSAINTQTDFSIDSKMATIVEKSKLAKNGEYNLAASRYKETQDFSNCKWDMVKLGDERFFTVESGGTPSSKEDSYWNGDINWVSLIDIPVIDSFTTITSTKRKITQEGLEKSSAKLLPINTVLISSRATIGRIAINKVELATNQGFKNIIIKDFSKVKPKYVAYAVKNLVPKMEDMATGGTFKEISKSSIMTLEIPLPPLEVQEEIVKELDGYQAIIDGAQKVIDNWKPTLPVNPEWKMVRLGDVCNIARGGSPRPIQDYITNDANGLNWLKIGDIEEGAKYIYSTSEKIKPEGLSKTRQVNKGDFILSNSMSFGRPYIMQTSACIHDGWLTLQDISPKLNKDFLYHILSTELVKQQFLKYAVGSTVKNLKSDTVKCVEIPLPPLEVQKEIVSAIGEEEKAIKECKKLIKLHQEKINTKIQSIWGDSCE